MARTRYTLGIELLERESRLVLVEASGPRFPVRWAHTVPAEDDLAKVYRGLPHRPAVVTCAVPLEHAALRILTLPPTTDENLERVVLLDAESVLPLAREDMALAHLVLGMTDQSRIQVLLGAARQDVLQRTLQRVNAVSWVSASATVSVVAQLNAVHQLHEPGRDGAGAILQVEADRSELIVHDRGKPLAAYSIPAGCAPAPGGATSWEEVLSGQARYLLQALAYERGLTLQRLYLCGAGAADPQSARRLAARLDLAVHLLDPCGEDDPADARYAVAYGCAVQAAGGAALTLNLTPARVTVAREVEQQRQARVAWIGLAGAGVAVCGLLGWAAFHRTNQAVAEAERIYRSLPQRTIRAEGTPKDLKSRRDALEEALASRVQPGAFLYTLMDELPEGAWLAQLSYNAGSGCVLNGYALDQSAPQRAQTALLRQNLFDEVTLDFQNEERIADKLVWGFQITCKLRPVEKKRAAAGGARGAAGARPGGSRQGTGR